jgi:geranylgeranyl pyrophosphate synthase
VREISVEGEGRKMTEERIQHFEKLCDVMHSSEATPKNVLQSLGKEAIAEIRRLQEENRKLREANEDLEFEGE